jgi:DNA replication protein DnaC
MNPEHPTVHLDHYLQQLKLPAIKRDYKSVAAACAKEGQDPIEFLARLCEREYIEREQRAARFPILKTLDTFDFAAQPIAWRSARRKRTTYTRRITSELHKSSLFIGNQTWAECFGHTPSCR